MCFSFVSLSLSLRSLSSMVIFVYGSDNNLIKLESCPVERANGMRWRRVWYELRKSDSIPEREWLNKKPNYISHTFGTLDVIDDEADKCLLPLVQLIQTLFSYCNTWIQQWWSRHRCKNVIIFDGHFAHIR